MAHVAAQHESVNVRPAPFGCAHCAVEVRAQLLEVTTICGNRVRAELTPVTEVAQIVVKCSCARVFRHQSTTAAVAAVVRALAARRSFAWNASPCSARSYVCS